jgi:hypothetical protein
MTHIQGPSTATSMVSIIYNHVPTDFIGLQQ